MLRTMTNQWNTILSSNILNTPEDVLWDPRGYLYIADTGNKRVIRIEVDPISSNLPPMFTGVGLGSMSMSWQGSLGWLYTIQYSTTSPEGPYTPMPDYTDEWGVEGIMNYTDTNMTGDVQYYNLRVR